MHEPPVRSPRLRHVVPSAHYEYLSWKDISGRSRSEARRIGVLFAHPARPDPPASLSLCSFVFPFLMSIYVPPLSPTFFSDCFRAASFLVPIMCLNAAQHHRHRSDFSNTFDCPARCWAACYHALVPIMSRIVFGERGEAHPEHGGCTGRIFRDAAQAATRGCWPDARGACFAGGAQLRRSEQAGAWPAAASAPTYG